MRSNNIYLSDMLAVPTPKPGISRREYRKKLRNRTLLWAVLPYLAEAVILTAAVILLMGGLSILLCGLGR